MKDISKMNETELKALAYDLLSQIESTQANLRLVNSEISKKLKDKKDED